MKIIRKIITMMMVVKRIGVRETGRRRMTKIVFLFHLKFVIEPVIIKEYLGCNNVG